uniref:Uncharacterized protein n=1 Tax=Compsopogon caeruleus TaxID=31354 RepID=A0A6T6D187_9RHOD
MMIPWHVLQSYSSSLTFPNFEGYQTLREYASILSHPQVRKLDRIAAVAVQASEMQTKPEEILPIMLIAPSSRGSIHPFLRRRVLHDHLVLHRSPSATSSGHPFCSL